MSGRRALWSTRARRRWYHAATWLIVTLVVLGSIEMLSGVELPARQELSLGLGYASLLALVVTLSLGPINVVLRRPNPVSTDLRRDAGLATALTAVAHTAVSLTNHFRGDIPSYFFSRRPLALGSIRRDWFGLGVWIGAVGVVVVLLLAGTSSDAAIRRLGRRRWKQVQRCSYVLAATVVVHTIAFWFALSRAAEVVVLTTIGVIGMCALQLTGRLRRTRAS